ncbi:hypothetical protein LOTGIDRAFT_191932 [Lottia gigantea]|uniref:Small ribosomal subunit protein mS25 n=1 Tax=Lottia gigantea TaxID=225164 RepID=V4A664_LOTGI|nr:hypothetical protein LOTGIDRAFT_191932 [Lottia gigantea]ESO90490.1 hypothetical protein LOTGIDRAFT_191932 [Lottia gigantea]
MPFMKGSGAIRRTLNYLRGGRIHFKDNVQIVTLNYNVPSKTSKGISEFVYWHLSQLQFTHPYVQIVTFKNMTPTPFITLYFDNGERMLVDCDSRGKDEIIEHLQRIAGRNTDKSQRYDDGKTYTKNLIGYGCSRYCICEVPGHVPCPGWVPLPKEMRGKHKYQKKDVEEAQ